MIAEVFWNLHVAVVMVVCSPKLTGLLSLSPEMRRWAPEHLIVGLALSKETGRSTHDAVQIWILVGFTSTLMAWVADEMMSMASGMYCGLIQRYKYKSSKFSGSLAPLSSKRVASESMKRETESTAAAKSHGEGGHPWSMPLLAWIWAQVGGGGLRFMLFNGVKHGA